MGTKEKNIQEDVESLIKIVESYTLTGKQILNNFSTIGIFSSFQEHILILLMERLVYNSIGVKCLLQEFKKDSNPHIEYSIGLLLRNCASDIITLCYINHLGGDKKLSKELIDVEMKNLLGSEIAFSMKDIDGTKLKDLEKKLVERYPYFFSMDNNKLVFLFEYKEFKTTYMANQSKKLIEQHFKGIKNIWLNYSKYEHLGGLTYDLLRLDFRYHLDNIILMIHYIINALEIIIYNQDHQDFKKTEFQEKFVLIRQVYKEQFHNKN